MHRGYVKLFRKTADNGLMKNAHLLQFWVWCLLKANHKNGYVEMIGSQAVTLEQGQFIFGRKVAAEALKSTEMKIRGCLAALEKVGCISIKSTNKFSIITICNWDIYQSREDEEQPTNNQQITNKQPTNNHIQEQRTNNKEKELCEKESHDTGNVILSAKGKKLTGDKLTWFNSFWDVFGDKRGRAGAVDSFLGIKDLNRDLAVKIYKGAKQYSKGREKIIESKGTPKMAQGWLKDRRWEDEEQDPPCHSQSESDRIAQETMEKYLNA